MKWYEVPGDELRKLISQVKQEARSRKFMDDDERSDHVLSNYIFPTPDPGDDAGWDAFYHNKNSPFKQYEDAIWEAFDADDADVDANGGSDTINEGKDVYDIMNQLPRHLWGEVIEHFNANVGRDIPNMSAAGRLQYCIDYVRNNHPEIDDDSDGVNAEDVNAEDVNAEDVNADGDTDVTLADIDDDSEPDTAIITADSKAEEKEATKAAKEELGLDGKDKTSTGKTKDELENKTLSDESQKNILSTLIGRRF